MDKAKRQLIVDLMGDFSLSSNQAIDMFDLFNEAEKYIQSYKGKEKTVTANSVFKLSEGRFFHLIIDADRETKEWTKTELAEISEEEAIDAFIELKTKN